MQTTRSNDYRIKYFSNHNGVGANKDKYFCAYCGKLQKQKNITIDHIVPIHFATRHKTMFKVFFSKRYEGDINSEKNLVPACRNCNSRKGSKIFGWILRGYLGRYQKLWFFRHVIRFFLFCFFILFIIFLITNFTNFKLF